MKVKFQYHNDGNSSVKQVHLVGSFNNWNKDSHPMKYNKKKSQWELSLDLPQGNYGYKFLLNGEDWIHDVEGERFIQNDVGTLDSIKSVKMSRKDHGKFSPVHPCLDDAITIYSTKKATLLWRINGWNSFPQNFQYKSPMEKDGKLYKATVGPFDKNLIPDVITYGFRFENGRFDNNEEKSYWIPVDLRLKGQTYDLTLESKALKREVPFRIYLPAGYFETDKKYPLMLLLHGYGGTCKSDWTQQNIIRKIADLYGIVLLWPDGNLVLDGRMVPAWYINSPRHKDMQMEDYIIKELIPYVESHYRVRNNKEGRGIAGISMGGFGSFYLATKYNNYFRVACSMSAIYNIHMFKTMGDIKNLVGRGNWKGRNFNVNKLIEKSKETDYYFIIGTEEGGAIEENIKLKLIMDRKKINHYFQIYPGNHTNNFWRMHIQEMMEYAAARLVKDRL